MVNQTKESFVGKPAQYRTVLRNWANAGPPSPRDWTSCRRTRVRGTVAKWFRGDSHNITLVIDLTEPARQQLYHRDGWGGRPHTELDSSGVARSPDAEPYTAGNP